ncbi:MAG: L,D-transpeptidase family protein [Bacteroidetes bacterium]|nr:L,D-transpeptidase family protein [Bacteroidota bacterium]
MKRRILIWLLVVFIPIISGVAYIFITWQKPPVAELSEARLSLSDAEKVNRSPSAEIIFQRAVSQYDSAMLLWQLENDKIFFLRNYNQVIRLSDQSKQLAKASIEKAKSENSDMKEILLQRKKQLTKLIDYYLSVFKHLPLSKSQRNEWTKGRMLLQEGIFAYNKENYELTIQKFDSAELFIKRIMNYSTRLIEDYFKSYPDWKYWSESAIVHSRKHKTNCVIIDKFARKCMFYNKGVLQYEFDIELGPNWIGDKKRQGDKSTPEGVYKVTRKKKNGETIYYKALLLNYPNENDKKRFVQNKKNGVIAGHATIGNLIEIHGRGGKGTDWTDGCIALKDTDMDKLFTACQVGTEVVIVGSLKTYDELLK